jgi:hypothetical protein
LFIVYQLVRSKRLNEREAVWQEQRATYGPFTFDPKIFLFCVICCGSMAYEENGAFFEKISSRAAEKRVFEIENLRKKEIHQKGGEELPSNLSKKLESETKTGDRLRLNAVRGQSTVF